MHVTYRDPTISRETLAKAINEICAGHADAELVDAIASNAWAACI